MCTKNGVIKKTTLEAYSRPRANGINAITIREGDQLLEVKMTNGKSHILLAIKSGRAIHFPEAKVRPMGRNAAGVRGIRMTEKKDCVIGMVCVDDPQTTILTVSEKGYGKRSDVDEYRITNRGGKGVRALKVTDKTGKLIAIKDVTNDNDLMIINKSGLTIRIAVEDLRVLGRATQGVRLISLKDGDKIAAVAKVNADKEEERTAIEGSELPPDNTPDEVDEQEQNDVDEGGEESADDASTETSTEE